MENRLRQALVAIAAIAVSPAFNADARAPQARAEFVRLNPCPATGKTRGACPGYVVDHVIPLCAAGPDHPSNMQWQTVADAKIKDRDERRQCAALQNAVKKMGQS